MQAFLERGFVKHRLNCLLTTDPMSPNVFVRSQVSERTLTYQIFWVASVPTRVQTIPHVLASSNDLHVLLLNQPINVIESLEIVLDS